MLDVVYRDARGRLIKLVGALTGEQLRTPPQRQIVGWNWTPTPAARIRRFGAFGPREDDQPIPIT
jgi:hypothetical protein